MPQLDIKRCLELLEMGLTYSHIGRMFKEKPQTIHNLVAAYKRRQATIEDMEKAKAEKKQAASAKLVAATAKIEKPAVPKAAPAKRGRKTLFSNMEPESYITHAAQRLGIPRNEMVALILKDALVPITIHHGFSSKPSFQIDRVKMKENIRKILADAS